MRETLCAIMLRSSRSREFVQVWSFEITDRGTTSCLVAWQLQHLDLQTLAKMLLRELGIVENRPCVHFVALLNSRHGAASKNVPVRLLVGYMNDIQLLNVHIMEHADLCIISPISMLSYR